jgi:membrane protein implicated in regulation of membrane protease activity
MSEPPNNRFKGPFMLLMSAVGLFSLIVGLIGGSPWWVIVLGLLVFVVNLLLWRMVRRGRNPWWLRSPLDPK